MPDPDDILEGEEEDGEPPVTPGTTWETFAETGGLPGSPTKGAAAGEQESSEDVELEAQALVDFRDVLRQVSLKDRDFLPMAQALLTPKNWAWIWGRFTLLSTADPKDSKQRDAFLKELDTYTRNYIVPAAQRSRGYVGKPTVFMQKFEGYLDLVERKGMGKPLTLTGEMELAGELEPPGERFPEDVGPPPPPGVRWNPKTGRWEGLPQVLPEPAKTLAEQLAADEEAERNREIALRGAGLTPYTYTDEKGKAKTEWVRPEVANRFIIGQAQARQMAEARQRQLGEFAQGERIVRQVAPYIGTRPETETQEESFQRGIANLANIEAIRGRRLAGKTSEQQAAEAMQRVSMMRDPNTAAYISARESTKGLAEQYPEEFEAWFRPRAYAAAPTTRFVPTPGYGATRPLAGQTEPSGTLQAGAARGGPLEDITFQKFLERKFAPPAAPPAASPAAPPAAPPFFPPRGRTRWLWPR